METRILIVDDEINILEVLEKMLDKLGYEAITVNDYHDAIRIFSEQKDNIGLTILDVSMPGITGEQLFKKLSAVQPDLNVLFFTGHDTQNLKSKLIKMGARGVFQKPIHFQDLSKFINDILQ